SNNMVNPAANIAVTVTGDNIELPSQRATSLALVANELLQNALEHGMAGRSQGKIIIKLMSKKGQLRLTVSDDGRGLPADFNMETDLGLGLEIVRTSVIEDMQGTFHLGPAANGSGTLAQITLPL
ncbi:MAG TPA: ATP-binding protein, partial [Anaerolineae bacterium]|nr:ATP-binding protein [Anaerolineae bacterium]